MTWEKRTVLFDLCTEARQIAHDHGFQPWVGDDLPTGLALLHSEISEALAEFRRTPVGELDMPDAFVEEMADVAIRLFDIMGANGPRRFADAVFAKLEKNKTRPKKHGGKRI
jgi:hypothetical protein